MESPVRCLLYLRLFGVGRAVSCRDSTTVVRLFCKERAGGSNPSLGSILRGGVMLAYKAHNLVIRVGFPTALPISGGVSERLNVAVLKTAGLTQSRGFESHPLRQFLRVAQIQWTHQLRALAWMCEGRATRTRPIAVHNGAVCLLADHSRESSSDGKSVTLIRSWSVVQVHPLPPIAVPSMSESTPGGASSEGHGRVCEAETGRTAAGYVSVRTTHP